MTSDLGPESGDSPIAEPPTVRVVAWALIVAGAVAEVLAIGQVPPAGSRYVVALAGLAALGIGISLIRLAGRGREL